MTREHRDEQIRKLRTEIAWARSDYERGGPNADYKIAGWQRQIHELEMLPVTEDNSH